MRAAETYRGARRNGSGAVTPVCFVDPRSIKVRPVPARPLLPRPEREKRAAAIAAARSARRHLVMGLTSIVAHRPARKKSAIGEGKLRLGDDHGLRKLMRVASRNGGVNPPVRKEKMRHAWFRRLVAGARLRARVGQPADGDRDLLAAE